MTFSRPTARLIVALLLAAPPAGAATSAPPTEETLAAGSGSGTPVVSISGRYGVREGASVTFTVSASPAPASDLTVNLTIGQEGDFVAAADLGSKTVTVPTSGSASYAVATVNDSTDESHGAVTATVATGNGYSVHATSDSASIRVGDNDGPPPGTPVVSISSGPAVTEGGSAYFTVSASLRPASNLTVNVTIGQVGGFLAAADLGSRTVTVPTSAVRGFRVNTVDDDAREPNGQVTAKLAAGAGYSVNDDRFFDAFVTVYDNDGRAAAPGGGDGAPPPSQPEPPASDCTLVAPYWSGPTGGFTVRPAPGRNSVSVTCGGRATEYMAEDGLVTRLVESSCRGTGLQLTGAAPGGWYWQHGDSNAAVAPLVYSDALAGPSAVVPSGVTANATDNGTLIRHDTAQLIGIVPHLAGNQCGEYVTPYWQGDGGVVVRPEEGRETVRVRVQCGRTYSTMTPSAGDDGVIAELVQKSYCTDDEGDPKQGRLTVAGAAPGGWYWISGERNAAVGPLMCADLLGGPAAVDPGGVFSRATEDGTYFRHDVDRLIGVVPHLAPNAEDN